MQARRFTVTISESCEATTPEHAAREIAWKLIRWDEELYGPLFIKVTDDEGNTVELTHDDYAPRFTWGDGDAGIF